MSAGEPSRNRHSRGAAVGSPDANYIPALRFHWLTSLYDPLVAATTRERTFKKILIEQARIEPGHAVLDLACGSGTLAIRIKQAVPASQVSGIDGDPRILSIAAAKAARAAAEVSFHQGLSYRLPYADGSFDRVLSSLFFHHLAPRDKVRTIREILRVLKTDGEFHLADWGRPTSGLMRALFFTVQLLDGFPNTRDNVLGRLPDLLRTGGFSQVTLHEELSTMLGTMTLYRARGFDR